MRHPLQPQEVLPTKFEFVHSCTIKAGTRIPPRFFFGVLVEQPELEKFFQYKDISLPMLYPQAELDEGFEGGRDVSKEKPRGQQLAELCNSHFPPGVTFVPVVFPGPTPEDEHAGLSIALYSNFTPKENRGLTQEAILFLQNFTGTPLWYSDPQYDAWWFCRQQMTREALESKMVTYW